MIFKREPVRYSTRLTLAVSVGFMVGLLALFALGGIGKKRACMTMFRQAGPSIRIAHRPK